MSNYLISKELMCHYLSFGGTDPNKDMKLEEELEIERLSAIKQAVSANIDSVKEKMLNIIREGERENCTVTINKNLSEIEESATDTRKRILQDIFNKYTKTEKQPEKENLFTEYMKKQVCADLPESGKLIDVIYQKCQRIKLSDRLSVINEILYKTLLEYMGTTNLVLPSNKKERIISDRIVSHTLHEGGRTPALCMKNTLKKDNTVVSYISYPDRPWFCKYLSSHYTCLNIPRFVNYVLNDNSEPVMEGTVSVRLCEIPAFQNMNFYIENYMEGKSLDSYMSDTEDANVMASDKVCTYMTTNVTDTDYTVRIGINKLNVDNTSNNADVGSRISFDTLLNNSNTSIEFEISSEVLSEGLNELFHGLIRKERALEDILNLFMQFLSIENTADMRSGSEGNMYFLGHLEKNDTRSNITKSVMAAIIAPIKKSVSGFNTAPDLSLIAKIAGLDEITVASSLYRFSTAFSLEFFESDTVPSGSPAYYSTSHKSFLKDSAFLHFSSPIDSRILRSESTNESYLNVIRPKLKKLIATKIASNQDSVDVRKELLRSLYLTPDECTCLTNQFMTTAIRPAISFYMSIVSTLNYIIGHKAASVGIYFLNIYQESNNLNTDPKVNSVVYGMGPGLIHAVFRSPITDGTYPDIAIPVSQYIMTNIATLNSVNIRRISTYVNKLTEAVAMFEYYLKKASKLIKRASRVNSRIQNEGDEILSNIDNLPDFKNIRTLYISDPDCINVFAPAFRGVFKYGDRTRLENMFAEARKKLEESYYVIAGRRPLVPEETLEDDEHNITLATDADRQNINPILNTAVYTVTVSDKLGISITRALTNPDISKTSLDARALASTRCENIADCGYMMDIKRSSIALSPDYNGFDLLCNEIFLGCKYPVGLRHKLMPSMRHLKLRDNRRGSDIIGLFTESSKWGIAHKYADGHDLCSGFPQLYQITDRRTSGKRYPVLAIPEKSGQCIVDMYSNGPFNSVSDHIFSEDGSYAPFAYMNIEISNQVLRMVADVNFLPPYTNYRFMEAERRRWNKQKYPGYRASMYTRFVPSPCNSNRMESGPYDVNAGWEFSNRCNIIQIYDREIGFHNSGSIGIIEKGFERKRKEILLSAARDKAVDENADKSWSQIWLENIIKQLNESSDNNNSSNVDPYSFKDEYIRQIILSLMPIYRNSKSSAVVHTLMDTEDISKSLNIYMELMDPEETKDCSIRARMRILALIALGMTPPCDQEFTDAVNAEDPIEVDNNAPTAATSESDEKYRPVCMSRELTEVASEIRVKSVRNKIDTEMRELRRQKEEYCRKYRECMNTLRKQRKSINDNRSFLNNKNIFTEEEKGIESLYNEGKILGYKLVIREPYVDRNHQNCLLDMSEYVKNKDYILRRISSGDMTIDLLALTAPVYIWSGAFIFSIGKVTINIRDVFNPVNIKPKFYNEDVSIGDKYLKVGLSEADLPSGILGIQMDAPHVREHKACLGNLEKNLNQASTEEDVLAYLEWCLQYLNTVNLGDTYGSCLSYFPCIPATMHNVIKYGVLASGRLDDRICLWTGAKSKNPTVSPYEDIIVQPVWNISDDLANALYEDAMHKIDANMFEGSDINEGHLIEIIRELTGYISANWDEGDRALKSILSYSLCKEKQEEEPDHTISSPGYHYVSDHSKFCSTVRAGIRQKLEYRDVFMDNSIRLLQHARSHNISFSDIWKPGMRKDLQIDLSTVKDNRLQNYCIDI